MRSTAAVTGRAQCAGSSTKPWSTTLQAVEAAAEAYPEIRLGRRRKAEASSQVQDVPFSGAIWPTVMQLGGDLYPPRNAAHAVSAVWRCPFSSPLAVSPRCFYFYDYDAAQHFLQHTRLRGIEAKNAVKYR